MYIYIYICVCVCVCVFKCICGGYEWMILVDAENGQ